VWTPPPRGEQLQYEVWELLLRVENPVVANPFWDAEVVADFTAPSGAVSHVEGFADAHDGSVFRLRFSPWEPGAYRVALAYRERDPVTRDVVYAAGHETGFRVTKSAAPGPLFTRDRRFVHSFRNAKTGRLVYPLPYNAPSLLHATAQRVSEFIQLIDEKGFDSLRFQVLAGSRTLHIPAGEEINPFFRRPDGIVDFRRYNLSVWRRLDAILADLGRRDMAAHLIALIEWGCLVEGGDKKEGNVTCDAAAPRLLAGSEEERKYLKDLLNRYAAYPNFASLILGNELDEYRTERWADDAAALIQSHSPYPNHPLISAHPSAMGSLDGSRGSYYLRFNEWWWSKPWCGAPSIQVYPVEKTPGRQDDFDQLADFMRWHRANVPLPMTNDESGWEQRPGDRWNPEIVRKTYWTNTLGGVFGAYGSILSITRGRSTRETPLIDPYTQQGFQHISAAAPFFKSTYHWLIEPAQERVLAFSNPRGHTPQVRALPGVEYVAYLPSGGSVSLDLGPEAAGIDLPVEWVNPIDGVRSAQGTTYGLTVLDMESPYSSPDFPHDALLHVGGPQREGAPYFADFESAARPWGFFGQTGTWQYSRGTYTQIRRGPSEVPFATTLATRFPRNFIASFDVQFVPGDSGFAGVHMRKTAPADGPGDSGYTLSLYPTGRVGFGKGVDGTYVHFGDSHAPVFEATGSNRVWVSAIDDRFEIRVNDRLVTRWRDAERSSTEGFLGLVAQQRAAFDNLSVQPILHDEFSDGTAESFTQPSGPLQGARGRMWGAGNPDSELRADGWFFQNLWMSFDATIPENGSVEARFRVRNPGDTDRQSGYSVDLHPDRVELYSAGGDRRRPLAEASFEPGGPKTPIPVRIEARGTRLQVFVNDERLIDAQDGQWVRGHVALVAKRSQRPVSLDNVLAVEITSLTTPPR